MCPRQDLKKHNMATTKMPLLGFKIRVLQTDHGSHSNIAHVLNLLILISNTQLNLITLLLLITKLITPHKHATHRNCIVMSQMSSRTKGGCWHEMSASTNSQALLISHSSSQVTHWPTLEYAVTVTDVSRDPKNYKLVS